MITNVNNYNSGTCSVYGIAIDEKIIIGRRQESNNPNDRRCETTFDVTNNTQK